jgi:multiple sugar transport system substrate-binding protein
MNEPQTHSSHGIRVSRRDALRLAGSATAGTLLATHGVHLATAQTPPPADLIQIPEPGPGFPQEAVSFSWMDNGGAKTRFFDAFFPSYQEAHPNVTVEYTALATPQMSEAIQAGLQNGNAPDVFQMPSGVTPAQAVQEGFIAPLDDVIPDFDAWKAALPPQTLQEGTNVFGGKVYSFPVNGTSREYLTLLYFNTELLQRAGYDPLGSSLTWDEFRKAAQDATVQGAGEYYGFILGGKSINWWAQFVANMARMAGASAGPNDMDWRTGEYIYASDQYVAAVELLLALRDDGSIFPGSMNLSFQEAASRMPTGVAAMCMDGPWNIAIWRDSNPELNFNVTGQPIPNTGQIAPITHGPNGGTFWLNASSSVKAVGGDILRYLGTESGMLAFQTLSGAPRSSIYDTVDQSTMIDERSRRIFAMYEEQMRLGPHPASRNPAASLVAQEERPLQPSFGEVVQGIFAGQIRDVKAAMQDLTERSSAELDRAIEAARAKGAEVSRDDWVFPNWDPAQDYTEDDYQALQ